MTTMWASTAVALFSALLLSYSRAQSSPEGGRDRLCCAYSHGLGNASSPCASPDGCVVVNKRGSWGNASSPPIEECRVTLDSKRENIRTMAGECLEGTYEAESGKFRNERLPFTVRPYLLSAPRAKSLPALEVRIPYRTLWQARFRILNTDLCFPGDGMDESSNENCNPRCVEIRRDEVGSHFEEPSEDGQDILELVYDCEVGFFPTETLMTHATSGNTYQIDICLENNGTAPTKCGSFLFRMPDAISIGTDPLILVEKAALLQRQKAILYIPEEVAAAIGGEEHYIIFSRIGENGTEEDEAVERFNATEKFGSNPWAEFPVRGHVSPGTYQVILLDASGRRVIIASFTVAVDDGIGRTTLTVVVIFVFILSLLICFMGYVQYLRLKRIHSVDPNRLLETGRIQPKNVLIITNVDNRHHVDILFALSKYLKDHCGVGQVYFAPDSETGISSQTNEDPWKWAQETVDLIFKDDEGCLVFVGAPPAGMGITIYKDLPNNQAFLSTEILNQMAEKHRICVLNFPYSDPETIPSTLPGCIRHSPLEVPKNINSFLCFLLGIEKRPLCAVLPIPFIQPEVCSRNLDKFEGGQKILSMIEDLASKVESFKRQQAEEDMEMESMGLLDKNHFEVKFVEKNASKNPAEDVKGTPPNADGGYPPLVVEIEGGIKSLKSKEMEERNPHETEEC